MKSKIITICLLMALLGITVILSINVNEQKESKFNIATSFYPMYIATLNITEGVEDITIKNLTQQTTGCIHDYVLTTSELVTLAKADVLIINGASMEEFMDKVISNFSNLRIIDASKGIDVIQLECDEHHDEHNEYEEHHHEINPHVFVSIKNYIKQVQNICDELVKLDTQNAETYKQNTEVYISKLEKLSLDIGKNIAKLNYTNIVTFHNSFDYFAREYGLNVIGYIENEHGQSPSAHDIAALVENIKSNNVKAIFVEPGYNIKLVNVIAKEAGVNIYVLNPVTSGDNNKDEYINIMKQNLAVLKEALQ